MYKIGRVSLLISALFLCACTSKNSDPSRNINDNSHEIEDKSHDVDDNSHEIGIVEEDVRNCYDALYSGDIDTVLSGTHPVVIEALGGYAKAREATAPALEKMKRLGTKIERLTFPEQPTFIDGEANEFVIVPTLLTISANSQRIESLNFQFGARVKGESRWKYIEGSRVNKDNVRILFPDFPSDYEFPPFYRKNLDE